MRSLPSFVAWIVISSCGASRHGLDSPVCCSGAAGAADPSRPAWEVHEWGLVDVIAATGATEIAAGPGRPTGVSGDVDPRPPMPTRKPVLYVHLGEGVEELAFRAGVTLPGGHVVEHWPTATLSPDGVAWERVIARAQPCPDGVAREARDVRTTTSARRSPVAHCGTPDGYCEVLDLPRYVTHDAACLTYAGEQAGLLFYRGSSVQPDLPLRVAPLGDGRVGIDAATSMHPGPSSVYRIRAGAHGNGSPPSVSLLRGRLPAPGASTTIAMPSSQVDRAAFRAALAADLTMLGMTAEETRTFLDAWIDELVVTPHTTDVLLYWLPVGDLDVVAALTFDPAPTAVRRAMLVRVDLAGLAGTPRVAP